MAIEYKRWSRLGLSAALAGTVMLSACGDGEAGEAGEGEYNETVAKDVIMVDELDADSGETSVIPPLPEGGEGEGGVLIDEARTDPVIFVSSLAITEAHIIAARDAYAQGETDAAAEMFAHPVSEVLFDMEEILVAQGVTLFDEKLTAASIAAQQGESVEQISDRTDDIIASLREAATHAPEDGTPASLVWAGVAADQIQRAAHMYTLASEDPAYEPYLDGYGFLKAAEAAYLLSKDELVSVNADAAEAIEAAIAKIEVAYPTAKRPETLPGKPSELTAASSNVALSLD